MQSLIKALVCARKEFKPISKDRVNPHYKNTYATLDSVLVAVSDALSNNGLAIVQTTDISANGQSVLKTTLWHESGESIVSTYLLPSESNAQKFGAALTYARRYSICAILNVTADEDDDGNDAVSKTEQRKSPEQKKQVQPAKGLVTSDDRSKLWAIAQSTGFTKDALLLLIKMEYGFSEPGQITKDRYQAIYQKAQDPTLMERYNKLVEERKAA